MELRKLIAILARGINILVLPISIIVITMITDIVLILHI